MRKWVILAALLAVVVAVVLIAVANLNRYLNRNREWLAEQASTTLGRKIDFDEIGVSLRGGVGARVSDLHIAEDPAFGQGDFVRVQNAYVLVKVLPALFGNYEIRRVQLDAPVVNVVKSARGFNFDSLAKPKDGEAKAAKAEESPGALPVVVSLLRISDGEVHYVDRTAKPASEMVVKQLDFSADDISLTTPISIDLKAALLDAPKQNVSVSGKIGPVNLESSADTPFDLQIAVGPFVINELKRQAMLASAIPPELSSDDPLEVRVEVSGTAAALSARTTFDATGAGIRYGEQFAKPKGLRFELDLDAKKSDSRVDIGTLALRVADADVRGKGTVTLGTPARVDVTLSGDDVPLSGWGKMIPAANAYNTSGRLGIDLAAKGPVGGNRLPELIGTVSLKDVAAEQPKGPIRVEGLTTTMSFKGDRADLPPTRFTLGGSPVEIEAKIDSISSPRGTFLVQSPSLRAKSLGIAGEKVSQEEVLEDLALKGSFRTPSAGPELDATIQSARGVLRDIRFTALDGALRYRGQRMTLERLALQAFDGTYKGSGYYDTSDREKPTFQFDSSVQGMTFGALVATYFPNVAEQIGGKLDTNLSLSGAGSQWELIRKTLKGAGDVEIKEGALKDFNLAENVLTGITGVPGLTQLVSPRVRQKYSKVFEAKNTAFDTLRAAVEIADGGAIAKDVKLDTGQFGVVGTGKVTFASEIDFSGRLLASEALTGDVLQDVKVAKYLTNSAGRLEIPFRMKGTLPKVKPQPDVEFIARAVTRAAVGQGLDALLGGKKKEGAPETQAGTETPKPGDSLKKGLEQLLGR